MQREQQGRNNDRKYFCSLATLLQKKQLQGEKEKQKKARIMYAHIFSEDVNIDDIVDPEKKSNER